jgi:hypothetical protein
LVSLISDRPWQYLPINDGPRGPFVKGLREAFVTSVDEVISGAAYRPKVKSYRINEHESGTLTITFDICGHYQAEAHEVRN